MPFFLVRAALYFGAWSFIALLYYRGSRGQDVTGDPTVSARLRRLAGPAIIVLAVTQTFASIDWIMSLTPHWYSTIFGVYFFAGSFVGFIALLSVVVVAMRGAGLLDTVVSAEHLHDIGKLLFGFTAFWAYIGFSQFFLMWYANLPEETIWYKARLEGSWTQVSLLLMAGHFAVPFFYLMGRTVKRKGATLAIGGRVAPRHALRGPLLAGDADAPSRRGPSVGSRRGRARRHRRVLRGGGRLAHATAGPRADSRPETRRIARLRERLRADRVRSQRTVQTARVGREGGRGGCTGRGPVYARPNAGRERIDGGDDGGGAAIIRVAITKEPSMRGTGNRLRLAAVLVAVSMWPGVAVAASSVTGTVTFAGKAPTLRPLTMDADPACAKKHTGPVPNEMLVLGSGNTMGNIMVWVSKGLPAGKTWPAPKTPVVLDQNGCQYKPHVMGIMVGQTYRILNSDGVLHNIHTLPKVNPAFNKGMPATLKETTTTFAQAGGGLPHQVRRPPLDERLRRRLHASVLLGDGHGREVHDLGPRPGHLRDHRLAREAGDADGLGHGGRHRDEDPGLQVRQPPARSSVRRHTHERAGSRRRSHAARRARSPSRGVGLLAPVRLLRRSQGHRHSVRDHRPAVPALRLLADDADALAARLPGRGAAADRRAPRRGAHAGRDDAPRVLQRARGDARHHHGLPRRGARLPSADSATSCCRSRSEPRTWRSRGSTWRATGSSSSAA